MRLCKAAALGWLLSGAVAVLLGQTAPSSASASAPAEKSTPAQDSPSSPPAAPALALDAYVLAPEDTVSVHVVNMDEIGTAPFVIDMRGNITIPSVGRVHAAGLTAEQLETAIGDRVKEYLQNPDVTVSVTQYRSQPVSLLGEVTTPGVQQVHGETTLFEVLSAAGGLKPEAGKNIKITRRKDQGPIPLPNAAPDASGQFFVAEVSARDVMEAKLPQENIQVKPYDVITVPKADMVYVIGAVKKAGGFILSDRSNVSVLEAMAMAEGLDHLASAKNARILRTTPGSISRTEVPVDLQKIMSTQASDIPMQPDDILFVPTSATKSATLRTIEAVVQVGTGLAIYTVH